MRDADDSGARVVAFPTARRSLARRRFRHWARDTGVGLLIALVLFVLFIVMLTVLGVHGNPCEPNQGC